MKQLFKNILKPFYFYLNKITFLNSYYSGIATIFMLHRVHPFESDKLFSNENMKIPPEFLEQFILKLKNQDYKFISLNQLHKILQNDKNNHKNIIFTLDDGYKDNYEIAYPIFKKYNIPFVIYLTTSFPENKAILWWYILEDLIIQCDEINLSENRKFVCKTKKQKEKVFLNIRDIILSFGKDNFLSNLNNLFPNYDIDWYQKTKKLAMNWKQIIKLSNDDLCTIAGHTKNHLAFNQLQKDEIINEIVGANKLIETKINKTVRHFSYPFGSRNEVGQKEFDVVKSLGFKTTTTTRRGNIFNQHKNYLECLPRIMLTEDFDIKSIGQVNRKRVVTL